ncbi:capsular biosynthesis protein [Clostridium perfringens]|uniref:tyrosine-protein phosphatase n=1 Tax=Clostridium perfringens TaxID=1502 RepID=UPI0024BC01C5|nr:CpsB/CapC family capsule biosynthesis tyrosine phosphatase [Clostridium perfringens]EGT3607522.1 capsular biosynthesis protein [Clostridium perfringens]
MVDIHSHIIPNIDDGSKSLEMSLEMLKRAEESGTKKIIATPHFFKGYWTENYNSVKDKVKELNKLAKENNLNIEIYPGQEVFFNNYILEDFKLGDIGTLGESRYMLIEFPMDKIYFQKAIDEIYELKIKGITPVIAHPERYVDFINNPEEINQFIDEGYLFQLNGGSLTGLFEKDVKKTAELFLENNLYSFIGSDAHSNGNRNTSLKEAYEVANSISRGASRRFEANGLALLNNEKIVFQGQKIKKKKKGLFSFFKR